MQQNGVWRNEWGLNPPVPSHMLPGWPWVYSLGILLVCGTEQELLSHNVVERKSRVWPGENT